MYSQEQRKLDELLEREEPVVQGTIELLDERMIVHLYPIDDISLEIASNKNDL